VAVGKWIDPKSINELLSTNNNAALWQSVNGLIQRVSMNYYQQIIMQHCGSP
jgi:hypothetical protein